MPSLERRIVVGRRLVPSYSKIVDTSEHDHYMTELRARLGCPPSHFPTCNPVGLDRKALKRIRAQDYQATLKSDGVQHVLVLTTRPGSTYERPLPVALMIDRASQMHEVDVCATEDYFLKGTVFDGELVAQQPEEDCLLYLVFDCMYLRGERMGDRPFTERIAAARGAVVEPADAADVDDVVEDCDGVAMVAFAPRIAMRVKSFVDTVHACRLWRDRGQQDHRVDGLVLQHRREPYRAGTARNLAILKWKFAPTVDLVGVPPQLRVREGPLPATLLGRRVTHATDGGVRAEGEGDVYEYALDASDDEVRLLPLRSRPDKTTPNALRVVEATLGEVLAAITPEELSAAS